MPPLLPPISILQNPGKALDIAALSAVVALLSSEISSEIRKKNHFCIAHVRLHRRLKFVELEAFFLKNS